MLDVNDISWLPKCVDETESDVWLRDCGGHRVADVDDGDGLGEDGAEEVGAAQVDQQQVVVALEELLLVPDGGDDHDVAEDAHQGQHHVHRHYEATLHTHGYHIKLCDCQTITSRVCSGIIGDN